MTIQRYSVDSQNGRNIAYDDDRGADEGFLNSILCSRIPLVTSTHLSRDCLAFSIDIIGKI